MAHFVRNQRHTDRGTPAAQPFILFIADGCDQDKRLYSLSKQKRPPSSRWAKLARVLGFDSLCGPHHPEEICPKFPLNAARLVYNYKGSAQESRHPSSAHVYLRYSLHSSGFIFLMSCALTATVVVGSAVGIMTPAVFLVILGKLLFTGREFETR